jgi:site-specific DNA-methyltransferase (adenine-specific)
MKYTIHNGNSAEILKQYPDNHFDSIVTDPPYLIGFLGKSWDAADNFQLDVYKECLRVLKPGGHILAFSAARTYHHLAITLEQAGFEIRDQIMWIYSSGFPKSQDVGRQLHKKEHGKPDKQRYNKDEMTKEGDNYRHNQNGRLYRILPDINGDRLEKSHEGEGYGYIFEEIIEVNNPWSGWGTALKPAHEPICMARKPMKLSIAKNCQHHGVGALNIDATRIPADDLPGPEHYSNRSATGGLNGAVWDNENPNGKVDADSILKSQELGRFPSNVLGEIPDYQKYFYCPKVSRRERHIGFELPPPMFGDVQGCYGPDGERFAVGFDARAEGKTKKKKHDPLGHLDLPDFSRKKDEDGNPVKDNSSWMYDPKGVDKIQDATTANTNVGNNHPTVKPIELMKYLIKLVTPKGGIVLDPFNGSGSTGCAAVELGHEYIGCELDEKYVEIAKKRIEAWNKPDTTFKELFGNG